MFALIFEQGWQLPVAVGFALLCAALIQRLLGFGFGLASLSSLTLIYSRMHPGGNTIQLAILVASVTALVPLLLLVAQFFREIDRRRMIPTLIGALVGLPVGMAVFEQVSAVALARMAGALLLILVVDTLRSGSREAGQPEPLDSVSSNQKPEPNNEELDAMKVAPASLGPGWGSIAGLISGVLHGSIGIPGPPIVYYGTRQNWTPNQFRAFVSGAMILVSFLKVILFAARGHISLEVVSWSMWGVPCMIVGYWLGAKSADRIPEKQFRISVLVLILVSAIGLLTYQPEASSLDETTPGGTPAAVTE